MDLQQMIECVTKNIEDMQSVLEALYAMRDHPPSPTSKG